MQTQNRQADREIHALFMTIISLFRFCHHCTTSETYARDRPSSKEDHLSDKNPNRKGSTNCVNAPHGCIEHREKIRSEPVSSASGQTADQVVGSRKAYPRTGKRLDPSDPGTWTESQAVPAQLSKEYDQTLRQIICAKGDTDEKAEK